jgi:hypothetical protein
LDASLSRGFPRVFHWTLWNGTKQITYSTLIPTTPALTDCMFLSGARLDQGQFTIRVDLQLEGLGGIRSGNTTKVVTIRPLLGLGYCGYS